MKPNVLYFPYIRVPKSTWLTRMLLYWDSVGTIVPYDFFKNPNKLGEHTRGLLEHELVKPIAPGIYVNNIPAFDSAFAEYLERPSIDIDGRCRRFKAGHVFQIHIEKMGRIDSLLIGLGLAREKKYPWFDVEYETAAEFMAYLAGCLGKVPEVNSIPVTDEEAGLQAFLASEQGQNKATRELNHLRIEVLEKLFPAPVRSLTATEIETFKGRHHDKLRSFRRAVEKEIIKLADLHKSEYRQRHLELFQDEIQELVVELNARFRESGFLEVVFGKLCPLLGAIPGAPFIFGVANAVYNAFGGDMSSTLKSPLAYAAYAQVDLLA